VEKLYAELKKAKGNPWPPKAFISTLSEAVDGDWSHGEEVAARLADGGRKSGVGG